MLNELLSGFIASVFVFCMGLWWKHRETESKIKGISLLLFFEVNDHLSWLENLNEISIDLILHTQDIEWDKNRYFLASNLPYNEFSTIIKHYRSMRAARKLLSVAKNPTNLPEEFRQKYIVNAQDAHELLFNLAKLDQQKLIEYNTLKSKQ